MSQLVDVAEEYCEFYDLPVPFCAHCLGHKADWEPKAKPRLELMG